MRNVEKNKKKRIKKEAIVQQIIMNKPLSNKNGEIIDFHILINDESH